MFVRIVPTRPWHVDRSARTAALKDAVSWDRPVLVAQYDADGRFIGLSFVDAPGKMDLPEGNVVLFWIDRRNLWPNCEQETLKP